MVSHVVSHVAASCRVPEQAMDVKTIFGRAKFNFISKRVNSSIHYLNL